MKKVLLAALTGLCCLSSEAQDFPGYRSGNYTGVNGVFFNPANIADSRYRFDFNLFSVSTLVGNDQASFELKNISEGFEGDSIKNQLFGKNSGPASGMMSLDLHGPSLMFNVGRKSSIALTTRARVFASVVDIDGELVDKISDDFGGDPDLPYTIASGQDMRLAVNAWTEFGVSYGRVFHLNGPHFLKGGLTLKYLAGAGNGHLNVDNFNGTIDEDPVTDDVVLRNATGRLGLGFGGIEISDFDVEDLMEMKSSGIGTDIGFVYEYRPGQSASQDAKTASGYKFKFGVALLDIGSIKYKKDMSRSGAYDINISGNESFALDELDGVELDDFNDFFGSRPQFFTPTASNTQRDYKVSLPTTLQIDADYHVVRGLYVSLASQIGLSSNKSKVFNNKTYTAVAITPRFEAKGFGFYLPVQYNSLTKFNAGASFRFGPFFIGSGSVLTALMGESKQVDAHFGVRFGSLKK